jgi:hypothetical protein
MICYFIWLFLELRKREGPMKRNSRNVPHFDVRDGWLFQLEGIESDAKRICGWKSSLEGMFPGLGEWPMGNTWPQGHPQPYRASKAVSVLGLCLPFLAWELLESSASPGANSGPGTHKVLNKCSLIW